MTECEASEALYLHISVLASNSNPKIDKPPPQHIPAFFIIHHRTSCSSSHQSALQLFPDIRAGISTVLHTRCLRTWAHAAEASH